MIRLEDLKAGDVVYECEFDSGDEPIDPADVPQYVSKMLVVVHKEGLRTVSMDGHDLTCKWWDKGEEKPVAYLHELRGFERSYAETEQEAIAEEAQWLEGYAVRYAADAKVLFAVAAGMT